MRLVTLRRFAFALTLLTAASPAVAQWTRVLELPATDVHSVSANADTIVAGADSVVHVSTNAGVTWKHSVKVADSVTEIHAVRMRNGRIYAGTFGQGVFVSDNLGDSWLEFNQGLVGGIFDSQLRIQGLVVLGDSLYAATGGSGVWVRNVAGAGTWTRYGDLVGDTTSSDVSDVAASDTRLVAAAGANGDVWYRDRGATGWTQSFLDNVGFQAGLGPLSAAWTGHGWVVGANGGLFVSAAGQEPWTPTGPHLGILFNVSFAVRRGELFADLGVGGGTVIEISHDNGASWDVLDDQHGLFVYKLAVCRNDLYAGRLDGLWRRPTPTAVTPASWGSVKSRFK